MLVGGFGGSPSLWARYYGADTTLADMPPPLGDKLIIVRTPLAATRSAGMLIEAAAGWGSD